MQIHYEEAAGDGAICLSARPVSELDDSAAALAEGWILDFLADKDRSRRKEILAAGVDAGHTGSTLERALVGLAEDGTVLKVGRGVYSLEEKVAS